MSATRGFSFDTHTAAREACRRKHGDWRYDPGRKRHLLRWWLPAALRWPWAHREAKAPR